MLCFTDDPYFIGQRFGDTPHRASLMGPFLQRRLLTWCLRITFWEFSQCFKLLMIIVNSDLEAVMAIR